jgi:hypothetical protein
VDIELMMMRANGWTVSRPRADGSVRARRDAVALARGITVTFEVIAPTEGDWTVTFRSSNRFHHEQTGPGADIASDAIAWAHRVASS